MKTTIETLKDYTNHNSDKSFAKFVGVTENTITRAKAGYNTKITTILLMLEWLLEKTEDQPDIHKDFIEIFG